MSSESELFFNAKPPEVAGRHLVQTVATGAAANLAWLTAVAADPPPGACWVVLEASGADAYVRFKDTATTAATTALNGLRVVVGTPRKFYVNPIRHAILDHFCATSGTLQMQVCSAIGQRNSI